jgi:hypothetical protein
MLTQLVEKEKQGSNQTKILLTGDPYDPNKY